MDEDKQPPQGLAINVNLDTTPILYTDSIFINTNPDGVTIDVLQRVASTNQARVVARIGMSRSHAKKFAEELGKLLAMTQGQVQTGEKRDAQ
jgi:hypothetical protein